MIRTVHNMMRILILQSSPILSNSAASGCLMRPPFGVQFLRLYCPIRPAVFKTPRIDVRRAVRYVHNRPELSEKLKTKASRRTVPIPQPLADCLKLEKEKSISDFVVANKDGGPRSGTQYRRLWSYVVCRSTKERVYYRYKDGVKTAHVVKPVLGEKCKHSSNYYLIDFDVTPHMLRHTYITNLLLAGVDVKTVQYLAGHERAKITLDIYAHLTYNRPQEIAEKIDIAFGRMAFSNQKK